MAKGSAYSVRRNDEMRRLYERGASRNEIAAEFGMSSAGVGHILRQAGVQIRPVGRPRGSIDPARTKAILKERARGVRLQDIGDRYGISRQRVHWIIAHTLEG